MCHHLWDHFKPKQFKSYKKDIWLLTFFLLAIIFQVEWWETSNPGRDKFRCYSIHIPWISLIDKVISRASHQQDTSIGQSPAGVSAPPLWQLVGLQGPALVSWIIQGAVPGAATCATYHITSTGQETIESKVASGDCHVGQTAGEPSLRYEHLHWQHVPSVEAASN